MITTFAPWGAFNPNNPIQRDSLVAGLMGQHYDEPPFEVDTARGAFVFLVSHYQTLGLCRVAITRRGPDGVITVSRSRLTEVCNLPRLRRMFEKDVA